MTKEQYHALAPTFDPRDQLVALIPLNVNRAGKHYKKLLKEIYETPITRRLRKVHRS